MSGIEDQEVREKVLQDYKLAQSHIYAILSTGTNRLVMRDDYLTPFCSSVGSLSTDHQHGQLKYFKNIRSALETALETGSIPAKMMPEKAPKYLTDLVNKEE